MKESLQFCAPEQLLVAIVNRYVVFEPEVTLPTRVAFDPMQMPELLPRLGGEDDPRVPDRVFDSLQIVGAEITREATGSAQGDFSVRYADGSSCLVEFKVRQGRPRGKDIDHALRRSREVRGQGGQYQTWFLDVEQVKLDIYGPGNEHTEMVVRDVWERVGDTLFTRANVVAEVEQWERRLSDLLASIQGWIADRSDLKCERTRSVIMSEELMQKYAVADRQLPIMDIVNGAGAAVASLVPRGLWLIGYFGRVDLITAGATHRLVGSRDDATGEISWLLSRDGVRKLVPLTANAFRDLVPDNNEPT